MPKYTLAVTRAVSYTEHGTFTTEAVEEDAVEEAWSQSDGETDVVWDGMPKGDDSVFYDDWESNGDPVLVVERAEFPPKEQCIFCYHRGRDKGWSTYDEPKCSECGATWGTHSNHEDKYPGHHVIGRGNACKGFKYNGVIWLEDLAAPSARPEYPTNAADCLFCYNRDNGWWRSATGSLCSKCGTDWSLHSAVHHPAHIRIGKCDGFKLNGIIWREADVQNATTRPEYPPSDQCLSCEHFARKSDWHKHPDILCSECGHGAGEHSPHHSDNRHDHVAHGCSCRGLKINGKIWLDEWTDEDKDSLNINDDAKPEFPPVEQCLFCEHWKRKPDWKGDESQPLCSECAAPWSRHRTHQVDNSHSSSNGCKGFKLNGKIWMDPPENLYGFFGNDNILLKGTVMCVEHVYDADSREMMQSAAEASGVWDGGDAQPIPNPNTLKCLVCADEIAA